MSKRSWWLTLSLMAFLLVSNASAGGSSVEDLAGVFSLEKTIKLGSSSSCFGGGCSVPDYLVPSVRADPMADDQPPSLAGFNVENLEEESPGSNLKFTIHVIDDQSGLGGSAALFKSPSGATTAEALFSPQNRISGTLKDGTYQSILVLPEESEKGTWLLDKFTLQDMAGNSRVLSREDVANLGHPVKFQIA